MTETPEKKTPEQIDAEVAKLKAEAERAKADARTARAEARKTLAEAVASEIGLRELQRKERDLLASDHYNKVYRFEGEVSAASVRHCMGQLAIWDRVEPGCDIEIVFLSPGGSIVHGLALFDYIQEIRSRGHKVTTKASGYAASMAGILLQAGDDRVMSAESWLLIHEASFFALGKIGEIEDEVEWIKRIQQRIKTIFASRSNLTAVQIERKWRRKDWWIDSTEALHLGLCDRVEGSLVLEEEKTKKTSRSRRKAA